MRRVAILFNHFGNPNQPFLTEWLFRILEVKTISVTPYTDRFFLEKNSGVVVLKAEGILRYFRYLEMVFLRIINRSFRGTSWQLVPLAKYRPDVIHLLNAQQWDQYQSLLSNPKIKFVTSFRGYETSVLPGQDSGWADKLQIIYQQATALHFVSNYLKNEAIKLGAPENKCIVIRRSVDTLFFKPSGKKANSAIHFIAVGRLTWQKGYPVLLRAFAELVKTNKAAQLAVVGTGPDSTTFLNDIEALGLTENVTHTPFLNRTDLREALWQADIFVQASLSDALPNSILEASACGLPVVSTLAGGIPEAVKNGETGLLVEPGNWEELAKAMMILMNDINLRNEYGENGRRYILEHFSVENEYKNWEDLYLHV
jgi:glycosyltransferase involved in cell wall biosynthesis